jgi:hypothetical protein
MIKSDQGKVNQAISSHILLFSLCLQSDYMTGIDDHDSKVTICGVMSYLVVSRDTHEALISAKPILLLY